MIWWWSYHYMMTIMLNCCQGGVLRKTQKSEQQSKSYSATHTSGWYHYYDTNMFNRNALVRQWDSNNPSMRSIVHSDHINFCSDQFTLSCCPCQSAVCASPHRCFLANDITDQPLSSLKTVLEESDGASAKEKGEKERRSTYLIIKPSDNVIECNCYC